MLLVDRGLVVNAPQGEVTATRLNSSTVVEIRSVVSGSLSTRNLIRRRLSGSSGFSINGSEISERWLDPDKHANDLCEIDLSARIGQPETVVVNELSEIFRKFCCVGKHSSVTHQNRNCPLARAKTLGDLPAHPIGIVGDSALSRGVNNLPKPVRADQHEHDLAGARLLDERRGIHGARSDGFPGLEDITAAESLRQRTVEALPQKMCVVFAEADENSVYHVSMPFRIRGCGNRPYVDKG